MNVKCKACKNKIDRDGAFKVVRERPSGKINEYYCNEEEYNKINIEKEDKARCYEVVKEVIMCEMITPAWVKNINTIREYYDYIVIEKCFKENRESINWSINNKDFKNEHNKAKYILSIVANNIADTKKRHLADVENMNRLFNKSENNEVNIDIINNEETARPIQRKKKEVSNDISQFL